MKPINLKEKAIYFRKIGYSYGMIADKLGLSKSTMSDWLKELPYKPSKEVIERIGLARATSAQNRHQVKVDSIIKAKNEAYEEIGEISNRDLKLLGIGLYLGEGSKMHENVRIVNSDPEIILLAIKWFNVICGVSLENIAITIHIYPDVDENIAKKYWSNLTNVPLSQFRQTQVDYRTDKTSKKKHKLSYGTAHLQIVTRGDKRLGVFLHRKIIGWIEKVIEQSKKMRV